MAHRANAVRAILTAGILCCAPRLWAQTLLEYQVKAAYLYNFAKFVTWPGGENSGGFTICVMGKDPFGQSLDDTVRGKAVRGQPIGVRRIPRSPAPQGCQIVFADFGDDMCRNAPAHADWDGVLLVGEGDEFAKCGGMIGLTLKDGKVRFDVNLEAVTNAHLEVSSKLLQVASLVSMAKRK